MSNAGTKLGGVVVVATAAAEPMIADAGGVASNDAGLAGDEVGVIVDVVVDVECCCCLVGVDDALPPVALFGAANNRATSHNVGGLCFCNKSPRARGCQPYYRFVLFSIFLKKKKK